MSKHDRSAEACRDSGSGKTEARISLLLLGVIVVIAAVAAASGVQWSTVMPSPHADPQAHATRKQAEEVARRFQEGVMMLHARQYDHALTAFHRVLQIDPRFPEAHVNAGFALLGMGNPRAAADFFDSATNLRPDQMNAYFGLGEALMALGDRHGALQAMETYLHRSPPDDRFRVKAEAAVWELRAELSRSNVQSSPSRK